MVQDVFQEVLTRIRQADAIAMGVGDISDRSLLIRNGLPKDVTGDDLIAAGAVGDMLGFFVDAEGGPIDHPITRRVIGIDPFELKSRPNVILAAGGAHKVAIIRAALGSGIFDVFVTDQRTAEAVLGE